MWMKVVCLILDGVIYRFVVGLLGNVGKGDEVIFFWKMEYKYWVGR